jgi:hypothetical protein
MTNKVQYLKDLKVYYRQLEEERKLRNRLNKESLLKRMEEISDSEVCELAKQIGALRANGQSVQGLENKLDTMMLTLKNETRIFLEQIK